jgi:hypothetical protein
MKKSLIFTLSAACACVVLLSGCGLAETGAVAATEAEQAKQAKETQEKVEQKLDEAQEAAAKVRADAEAATQ